MTHNPTFFANSRRTNPLFKCHTFEVLREREGLSVVINLRFGAYNGHVLEFRVSRYQTYT